MTENFQETEILQVFIGNLSKLGLSFAKKLFKISQDFQIDMKQHVKDEKLSQCYQLMINNLLKYGDKVRETFNDLDKYMDGLVDSEKALRGAVDNMHTKLEGDTEILDLKIKSQNNSYNEYIYYYTQHLSEHKKSINVSDEEIQVLEQNNLDRHEKLDKFLIFSANSTNQYIGDIISKEARIKETVRETTVNIAVRLMPEKEQEVREKMKSFDRGMGGFHIHFKDILNDMNLGFCKTIRLENYSFKFRDFYSFYKLDCLYDIPYSKFLFHKIKMYGKKVSPQIKIYVELLCEKLYLYDIRFDDNVIDEVNHLLSNSNTRDYLMFCLMHKKTQILMEKPFSDLNLTKIQLVNIMQIAKYYLHNCSVNKEMNYETMYHFLKYSFVVYNPQKDCLLQLLNKNPIFYDMEFWKELMRFFFSYLKPKNANKTSSPTKKPRKKTISFRSIFSNLNPLHVKTRRSQLEKAFEEVSILVLRCKLDFETLTGILLKLAPIAKISFDNVKNILKTNEDLFFEQMRQEKTYYIEYKKNLDGAKALSKNEKVFTVIKRLVRFIEDPKVVISFLLINKHTYDNRHKIFRQILLTRKIKEKGFRIFLLSHQKQITVRLSALTTDIPKKEIDPIISLDVKRTFSEKTDFDHKKLELILINLNHKDNGNFAYYQGMNYIVSYFLLLFKNKELLTYNVVINIMYSFFSPYVDTELINIKKLFFYLKRLIKIHLPTLSNYLENEQKLDTDIVFASWCLTLFTTVVQYHNNTDLLDQIIDIFISKGWPGLFRVILVILDELQETIFRLNYEEILILLAELPKNNFYKVLNPDGKRTEEEIVRFNFKKKIEKYRYVNKSQMPV